MTADSASVTPPSRAGVVEVVDWGEVDGAAVQLVTLISPCGVKVGLSSFGATLVSIEVPHRHSAHELAPEPASVPAAPTKRSGTVNVLLGLPDLNGYRRAHPYLGGTIGRLANRVLGASFELAGRRYALRANEPGLQLHGGERGFDRRPWLLEAATNNAAGNASARFSYLSIDGEEGYPGNLKVSLDVELSAQGRLALTLNAEADRDTPVALTHHPYFNLAGRGTVLDHELELRSSFYAPTGRGGLPSGEVRTVAGSPFDFRDSKTLGADLGHPLVAARGGYDDAFVIDGRPGELRLAGRLSHFGSGRSVEIFTTQPGLQVYSANQFDGTVRGSGGVAYRRHAGVALEAQALPNAVNMPHLGDVVLKRGARYHQQTEYRFGW